MEKFKLNNGLPVVFVSYPAGYSVCLSVNVGHVNEPKLGIANLFERTLLQQVKGIIPVFGGTMTAYTASAPKLQDAIAKVVQICNEAVVNDKYVELAKASITQQTKDTAPLTMRRMKLLYKHTAFGADLVKTTDEYLEKVNSYTVEEVREFANSYYNTANMLLVVSGPKTADRKKVIADCFADVQQGVAQPKFEGSLYTGGGHFMRVDGDGVRLMFGWDVQHLTARDSPTANVMMSMFLRRLERAYVDAGMHDVSVDFKIAGYYGLRTMRAFVASPTVRARELTDVFINVVNRICDTEASDVRMEKSRNAAMVEKLDKYERSDDRALETAWQIVGRGSMYDVSNRIQCISETTAHDVKMLARDVFRGSRVTYIVAASLEEKFYSYKSVMTSLGLQSKLKDAERN